MSGCGTDSPDGSQSGERELTCEESLARVYEYLDGELGIGEHEAVKDHLEKCRECYPHYDFERLFLDYVHELGAGEESRPGLKERVQEMLAAEPG